MTRTQHIGVIIGLAIVAVLTFLRAGDPQFLRSIRDVSFDEYQRISPRPFENLPVRVIDIDEASLREFGQWPWPRDDLLCSSTDCRRWARRRSPLTFFLPSLTGFRRAPSSRSVTGVDPGLLAQLPDNDEIFAECDCREACRARLRFVQ